MEGNGSFFLFLYSYLYFLNLSKCSISILDGVRTDLDRNSDMYKNPSEIIRKDGYPVETHTIESEDGYLITYFRIPHGKNKNKSTRPFPVVLHHGLLDSPIAFLCAGVGNALAYILADEGYDVWLASARGTTYSRGHRKFKSSDKAYWDFSFHESGVYDLAAAIDYILHTTRKQQVIYIGHSLGTATFYVLTSERPEYGDKVLLQISMGPVSGLSHMTSIIRLLVPLILFRPVLQSVPAPFLGHNLVVSLFVNALCGMNIANSNVCNQLVIGPVAGEDKAQFNQSALSVLLSGFPAGTSFKNVIHTAQLIKSVSLQKYDYGAIENLKKYGSVEAPPYNISNMGTASCLIFGENDLLTTPTDSKIFYQLISKPLGLIPVRFPRWTHVDFLYAKEINKYLHDKIIALLNSATTKPGFVEEEVKKAINERNRNPFPKNVPFTGGDFLEAQLAQHPRFKDVLKHVNKNPQTWLYNIE